MTPLINHLTISKIFIILYLTLTVSFVHSTFCVLVFYFYFLVLLLHENHVQPVCTFLSCTFLLILIFKSTVYCHAHFLYFIFCSLYLIFYLFHFMYISSVFVFYNICTVHGADLTHISLLVIYSLYNRVCDK